MTDLSEFRGWLERRVDEAKQRDDMRQAERLATALNILDEFEGKGRRSSGTA